MSFDASLLIWINQQWADPGLDFLFQWVSGRMLFSIPLLFGLLLYLWRHFHTDGIRLWLLLILGVSLGDVLGNLLKAYFAMPRPCYDLFELLRPPGGGEPRQCNAATTGMPSSHALNFFAVAAFLAYTVRKTSLSVSLFLISLVVGLSRIYLAKHYPSQVLAGAAIGVLFGYLFAWLGLRSFAFGQRLLLLAETSGHGKQVRNRCGDSSFLHRLLRPTGPAGSGRMELRSPMVWLPLLFSLLAMGLIWLNSWNELIFFWLNQLGPLTSDRFWASVTLLGDTLVVLALLGLLVRHRPDLIGAILITILFANLWVHGLKPILANPRPLGLLASDQVHLIGQVLRSHSFPSGHTTTAFALASVIVLARVRLLLAIPILSLACLAGISRAVVGAHWPLDILVGMFGGWLSGVVGVWLAQHGAWQPGRWTYFGLMVILTGCALALLITRGLGYPQAIPLQMLIGLGCLVYMLVALKRTWQTPTAPFI